MKKLILAIITLSFFACSQSPVEKLISNYEQTIEGTHTDLNLKIQELKFTDKTTVSDSIKLLKTKLCKIWYGSNSKTIDTLSFSYVLTQIDTTLNVYLECIKLGMSEYSRKYDNYAKLETKVKTMKCSYDKYIKMNKDVVLSNIYQCTYTINNPFLNGVKQTLTKTYIIDTESTKIISSKSNS